MITHERVAGGMKELKGKAESRWGQFTDDEWRQAEGGMDQFLGMLQRKTGETREQLNDFVESLSDNTRSALEYARAAASDYSADASAYAHDAAARFQKGAADNYERASDFVKHRPTESLVVALGTGILIGVVVSLFSRNR